MKYIVTDNESLFTYDSEYNAYLKYIDIVTLKCNFLKDMVKVNNQMNIPDFMTTRIFCTEESCTVDILYLDINDYKFKRFANNNLVKYNIPEKEVKIIETKLDLLKKYKFILESFIINQSVFMQHNNTVNNHLATYSNDSTSDVMSNLNLDLESINGQEEEDEEESEIIAEETTETSQKKDITEQKKRIEKLLELKKQLEHNKKKKEKLEEMLRRYEVDLEMYLRLKNVDEVPELFKYKFPVFKEMEDSNILNDSNAAKKYYIKNFNRINMSVGSTIFGNVFNQKEVEEDYEDISDNLNDSDENKITLSSEEIQISQAI